MFPCWLSRPFGEKVWQLIRDSPVTDIAYRFATATPQGLRWHLRRNCSITPVQLGGLYASLCAVSLGIAGYFWLQGAPLVLPFALLELLAVGAALFVYARHAVDGERIALIGSQLVVELDRAGKTERFELNPAWLRIEPSADERSLVELSAQGRRVQVGRFIRPELRTLLAKEIRVAVRGAVTR
jgi:uncharacterized membrane protein